MNSDSSGVRGQYFLCDTQFWKRKFFSGNEENKHYINEDMFSQFIFEFDQCIDFSVILNFDVIEKRRQCKSKRLF